MKIFSIFGEVVDTLTDKWSYDDVCPDDFRYFLDNLEADEDFEIQINSVGGSCSAGIAISNMIRLSGRKTKCTVLGLAASISSVIACSCDELIMPKNSMLMCHLPWASVVGNEKDLDKAKSVLENYKKCIISVYKSKFELTDEQFEKMLVDETWIVGENVQDFKLKCTVIDPLVDFKVAACAKMPEFKKAPEQIKNLIKITEKQMPKPNQNQDEQGVKNVDTSKDVAKVPVVENRVDPVPADDVSEQKETMITLAECEKRVSGMQSTMAKQMDSIKKDYESKIAEFKNQISAKDEELKDAKNSIISLEDNVKTLKSQLDESLSSLEEKQKTLDCLNHNVLSAPEEEELPKFEDGLKKCKSPEEIVDFIKSGKYIR